MTEKTASRTGEPRTLRDVLDDIARRPGLTPTRRRDLGSALRALERLLDRPLEQLPADVAALREALREVHPAAFRMSPKRFANIRSDVLAALRLAGVVCSKRPKRPMLAPAWQRLRDACPRPQLRWRLSRFMRWCSAQGIDPQQVSPDVLDRYYQEELKGC